MITFEEAKTLHAALQYDSVYSPRARLEALVTELAPALDQAITLVGKAEIIVFPWQHAMPFKRQWQVNSEIRGSLSEHWLWGYLVMYRGIDCFATSLAQQIVVSGVRDLRQSYAPEDRIVLIDVTCPSMPM